MNTAPSPEILLTAAEVAKASGVDVLSLRAFEPEGFGSPGHWRLAGGNTVYTAKGAALLVEAFDKNKMPVAALGLRMAIEQRRKAVLAPTAKAAGTPWYNQGAMA